MTQAPDISLAEKILTPLIEVLEPKLDIELADYAEQYIKLLTVRTRWKGQLSLEKSPYMVGEWGPLWAWKKYKYISNIWATQTGKTTILFIIFCYIVDVDPGDIIIVMPDQTFARKKSKKDIMPLIRDNLTEYLTKDEDDFSSLEYIFKHMTVAFGWSGSASSTAGDPCKYALNDETGKNQKTIIAGDSYAEADRRTQSYGEFGKNYMGTTPSLEDMPGDRELKDGCWAENRLPCYECKNHQVVRRYGFDPEWDSLPDVDKPNKGAGGISWDDDNKLTKAQRAQTAHYECCFCGAHWNDAQLNAAVETNYDLMRISKLIKAKENKEVVSYTSFWNGFIVDDNTSLDEMHFQKMAIHKYKAYWKPRDPDNPKYSSHLASWYSLAVKLSEYAARFIKAEKDSHLMQDVINADHAEAYSHQGASEGLNYEHIKKLRGRYNHGNVPVDDSVALFMTVDVHLRHIDVRVRAWCQDMTSYGVDYVKLIPTPGRPLLEGLDGVFARTYPTPDGREIGINFALVDARYKPNEVGQFCLRHLSRAFPIQGGSFRDFYTEGKMTVTAEPELGLLNSGTLTTIKFDDYRLSGYVVNKLSLLLEDSPGRFWMEEDSPDELLKQVSSARLATVTDKKGKRKSEWLFDGENHGFDLEKYQCLAALVFQVADANTTPPPQKPAEHVENPYSDRNDINT